MKKKTQEIQVSEELVVELETEIPNFSELYQTWASTASSYKLNTGRTSTDILEFISNMGVKGRAKSDGSQSSPEAPIQEYVSKAKDAGKKNFYSNEQVVAITALKTYLDENNNGTSKVNPANIMFTSIRSYSKDGKITGKSKIFGDFRTPKYVKYRGRHKNETVDVVPTHFYNKNAGKAKPPVWQALFGDGKLEFKHPSLLMMCNMVIEAIPRAKAINRSDKPLNIALKGKQSKGQVARWVYENLSGFKGWFDQRVNSPAYVVKTSGNFASRKVYRELVDENSRRAKISFKLSDAESTKLLEWLGAEVKLDLENVFLRISRRQIANMAEIAGFKNKKPEEKLEKQDSSDWKEIVKVMA